MELSNELEKYVTAHIDEESEVLKEINRYTNINMLQPRMLSGHIQGMLLKMFCRMIEPLTHLRLGHSQVIRPSAWQRACRLPGLISTR